MHLLSVGRHLFSSLVTKSDSTSPQAVEDSAIEPFGSNKALTLIKGLSINY